MKLLSIITSSLLPLHVYGGRIMRNLYQKTNEIQILLQKSFTFFMLYHVECSLRGIINLHHVMLDSKSPYLLLTKQNTTKIQSKRQMVLTESIKTYINIH